MSADSIQLPKAFASSGDPIDGNPFAPENPRHVAWSEATRVAELEACDLAMRKMSLVSSFADFVEHPFSPREWLVAPVVEEFDIWAKRFVHVVWSDVEVRLFDDWLVTYANALMDTLTGFLKRNPPPFDADAQLTDARNSLGARVQYWRGAQVLRPAAGRCVDRRFGQGNPCGYPRDEGTPSTSSREVSQGT